VLVQTGRILFITLLNPKLNILPPFLFQRFTTYVTNVKSLNNRTDTRGRSGQANNLAPLLELAPYFRLTLKTFQIVPYRLAPRTAAWLAFHKSGLALNLIFFQDRFNNVMMADARIFALEAAPLEVKMGHEET
jgi:hypothetical protein